MSVNHHMHPRNIYKKPPNFVKLALEYPEFKKFVKQDLSGKISINFKEREAVLALTKALLQNDFGLSLTLPENRLVPTLPLRLNYILWLEDLLQLKYLASKEPVHGIDIGTGAACIYPLLAAKKNSWNMLATEVDGVSIEYANSNVTTNELTDLIKDCDWTDEFIACYETKIPIPMAFHCQATLRILKKGIEVR
ncbi:hypothetical protein LSTR_LSTR013787 [Laodelphax striatellus]|uniref:U6 small nuclear RNA (adenine-(43)-N(6))-methyltransferase n=1 Tax=Laodelphax striatellus TaxID=195883 RepID=A0A482XHX6_LAOST|nr:hypothetical protein LSTR_LSTR013787 [Laodelphax striatellus]